MLHNRLGLMGHYYGGMLDIYSDLTQHCATFGGHIEILEVDELAALGREVTPDQSATGSRSSATSSTCSPTARPRSSSARPGLRSPSMPRRASHDLGSLAYYYMGVGKHANEDAISSIILGNSLLTARGIPVAGEIEVKNVQAMKILDTLRRRRLLHRVLRDGLYGRRGADGPRRARATSRSRKGRPRSGRCRCTTARWAAAFPWR